MNNLPDDVIQQIYTYKHNLEYVNAINQLFQTKINVYVNVSLKQSIIMGYAHNHIK